MSQQTWLSSEKGST